MAKFKNKETGVILTTKNPFVIEQLKKSEDYKEVKGKPPAATQSENGDNNTDADSNTEADGAEE